MKSKRVLFLVESPKKAMDRAFREMQKPTKKYAGVTIVTFPNYESLGKVITPARLQLLAVIRAQKPKSLQELARFVDRDFKNVYQDVQILEQYGLVETKTRSRGKASAPVALFEEIILAA